MDKNKKILVWIWLITSLVLLTIWFFAINWNISVENEKDSLSASKVTTNSWATWIKENSNASSEIVAPVDTKVTKTVLGKEIKDVNVKTIEWKTYYNLNKAPSESVDSYLKRIWKSNTCYITQFLVYNEMVLNNQTWAIQFDKLELEIWSGWTVTKVNDLIEKSINKEEWLEKNPEVKKELVEAKNQLDSATTEQDKERLKANFDSLLLLIPAFEIVRTEKNVWREVTFDEVMKHYESTCTNNK